MIYEWTSMQNYFAVDAQTVGETMERIELTEGQVTRENFLEASRPETAPTHKLFEWDDTKAAELYRLRQSSEVIQHIAIKVQVTEDEEPVTTRAFVNVVDRNKPESRYINVMSAMSDTDMRNVVINNAYKELCMFQKKYEVYSELQGVFDAINDLGRMIQ